MNYGHRWTDWIDHKTQWIGPSLQLEKYQLAQTIEEILAITVSLTHRVLL
jgi:hypothetical protein